jgi:hypothetical protein
MHLTYHSSDRHTSEASTTSAEAGAPELEVTGQMIEAGSNTLDEFIIPGGGLMCSPTYVAEAVYRAMEKQRLADSPNAR